MNPLKLETNGFKNITTNVKKIRDNSTSNQNVLNVIVKDVGQINLAQ